jgi:hypothetical protein
MFGAHRNHIYVLYFYPIILTYKNQFLIAT